MSAFVEKSKRFIVWGLERVFGRKPVSRREVQPAQIHRILIVSGHRGLGDVLLATPVLRAVRQDFPNAYIAMAVGASYSEALQGNIYLNWVIPVYENWRSWSLSRISMFIKQVRGKYDLAIVLAVAAHSLSADLIAAASRARYILGPENMILPGATECFFYNLRAPFSGKKKHLTERNLEIVRHLDMRTDDLAEVITLSKDERDWARDFLLENGLRSSDAIAGIHITADDFAKQWELRKFMQVAKYLAAHHGTRILVSWGDGNDDLGQEFLDELPFSATAVSGLPLRNMAAVLHFMNVVVCNECDAMHIAAAVGTPVVAVYCEGSPDLTKPAGSEFVAVKAQSISASSSGVDVVIESALRLLRDHPKLGRLEADEFDISDEVINEYLGILNTFDG